MKKKKFLIYKLISNTHKHYLLYYVTAAAVLSCMIVFNICTYHYLRFIQKEKEIAFTDGVEESVRYFMQNELGIIFDKLSNLDDLSITKNYSHIKKNKKRLVLSGSVLYIDRDKGSIVFDLQSLTSILNSILGSNFYYKLVLNNEILLTNVQDIDFAHVKKYQINEEIYWGISLLPKPNSFTNVYFKNFNRQMLLNALVSIILFSIIALLSFLIIRRTISARDLRTRLLAMEKGWELNTDYIKLFYTIEQEVNRVSQNSVKPFVNQIQVVDLLKEIEICALAYTYKFQYKFELEFTADLNSINLKYNALIFKQIIISLLYNILYFMRGGTHIKKFAVRFQKDNIVIIYDSFAANEDHMCRWSRGLFEHLGNPYILECDEIFQLLKTEGLSYAITPKQGNNKIEIFFGKNEDNSRVIKFKKSS